MTKLENDLGILYYAVGNTNTQRQENKIATIMKKRNSAGWKLISTCTAIIDTKTSFQTFIYFLEKNKLIVKLFYTFCYSIYSY